MIEYGLAKLQELRESEKDPVVKAQYQKNIDEHFFGNMAKRKNKKERRREKRRERLKLIQEEEY